VDTCSSRLHVCLALVLAVFALILVTGCGENVCDAPEEPALSVWSGNVGGGGLRLELSEARGAITGRAIVAWPVGLDSVPIRAGWLAAQDSFYLDITEVPAPIGCTRIIMGEYLAPYGAVGIYWERCGHDPVVNRFSWSAGKWDGEPSLYGSWAGQAGRATLKMELGEAPEDSVGGYVSLYWPSVAPETLLIRSGSRYPSDSLFLDISDIPPAPFGCYRTISGHFESEDQARGVFFERCGHDPTYLTLRWEAVRVDQ
jgi:hypothetical protein